MGLPIGVARNPVFPNAEVGVVIPALNEPMGAGVVIGDRASDPNIPEGNGDRMVLPVNGAKRSKVPSEPTGAKRSKITFLVLIWIGWNIRLIKCYDRRFRQDPWEYSEQELQGVLRG